ncbi:MAG: HAD hydrolase family protein [Hominisplanchenecus sp.]
MRKALFFDIDGTILSDITGTIPQSAVDALQRTKELGILLLSIRGEPSAVFRRN